MTDATHWVDELPLDAPERELLLAGKAARPPEGSMDADWQALCVVLGATAAGGASASGVALNSAGAKTVSAVLATKAAAAAPWVVTAKWFVMGAALGCGVAGASAVVQRATRSDGGGSSFEAPSNAARALAPQASSSPRTVPAPHSAEEPDSVVAPVPESQDRPVRSFARPDVSQHA